MQTKSLKNFVETWGDEGTVHLRSFSGANGSSELLRKEANGSGGSFLGGGGISGRVDEAEPRNVGSSIAASSSLPSPPFSFALFYNLRTDEIQIVAVADLRRDPERWEHLL